MSLLKATTPNGSFEHLILKLQAEVEALHVAVFRKVVWDLFLRILDQTPQWSGKAVANWNITIGSPDLEYRPGGEMVAGDGDAGRRGDHGLGWQTALTRAQSTVGPAGSRIKYGDRVFIANGVMGDDPWGKGYDEGSSLVDYLAELQDAGNWQTRLRAVNQPYETVKESILIISTRFSSQGFQLPT